MHILNGEFYGTEEELLNLVKDDVNNFFKITEKLQSYKIIQYMLKNITNEDIDNLSEENLKELVNIDTYMFERINNPSYNVCLHAVSRDGTMFESVQDKHKTKELCRKATQQYCYILEFIKPNQYLSKDEYKELLMMTVYVYGEAIRFVPPEYQSEELCTIALEYTPLAIQYICNPTVDQCIMAAKSTMFPNIVQFIPEHMYNSEEFIKALIDEGMFKQLEHINMYKVSCKQNGLTQG